MKHIWKYVLSGALMMSMVAPAMAKDHDRDRDHHSARAWREHREREHRREYRRERNDHDRHNGWDRGHKTGWHGNNVPPGQAKKHRDYDHDRWARERRRHHRATYARGPVVTPRTAPSPARTYPTTQPQHGRGPIPVPNAAPQPTTTAQKPSGRGPIVVPVR
jgi:hypothetical protein